MPFAAAFVVIPDHQQAGVLALRTGIGLERYPGKPGDLRQPRFQFGKHLLIPVRLLQRHEGMHAVKFRPAHRLHLGHRVELHGARAERDHALRQRQVAAFESFKVTHQLGLRAMLVEHLVREKLAGAPERFGNNLRRGQFLQRERHIAPFVEDLQEFHHVRLAGRFVQRHADGLLVQHAQVDPVRLRNACQVFGTLIGVLHRERIEIHRVLYRMPQAFQTRGQESCQAVHATSDFTQAIGPVITGVHRRHVGQQCLRRANVAGCLVSPDVLLARL